MKGLKDLQGLTGLAWKLCSSLKGKESVVLIVL